MGSKRIMVIDDEPEVVNLIEVFLQLDNFEVHKFYDARSALVVLRRDPTFDLILLDIMMPGMDGWELYKTIKKENPLKTIPVAIITAKSKEEDRRWAIEEQGVDDYIVKPFGMSDFMDRVHRLVKAPTH